MYQDDNGQPYALKVDADYAAQPERGWVVVDPTSLPQFPRGWRARAVLGLDEEGRSASALIANLEAELWQGLVQVFTFNGTDELPHVASVIGRRSENRLG